MAKHKNNKWIKISQSKSLRKPQVYSWKTKNKITRQDIKKFKVKNW